MTRSVEKIAEQPTWIPRTRLGSLVVEGQITSMNEIFENGMKIKEPEIVRTLIPDIKTNLIGAGIVQKQTDAGELTRFKAIMAVGNEDGWFGLGNGKARQMRTAIDKATNDALLNIIPVKIGCGSWECRCMTRHSIPSKTIGKGGSVRLMIIPGPRGLGLVAGEKVKSLLTLAGITDAWTKTFGSTSTTASLAYAVYDALRNVHGFSAM
jgi:small subunit ribosomal protein S5